MRRKILVLATIAAVIGTASFYRWANMPAVSKVVSPQTQVKSAVSEEYVPFTNAFVSMQIPKKFEPKKPIVGKGKPLYLQQLLTVPLQNGGMFSDQLALVVGELPAGGLSELSDLQLRARSSDYTQLATEIANSISYESLHDSNYEVVYFSPYNSKYISISLTTNITSQQKAKDQVSTIARSIRWLQN